METLIKSLALTVISLGAASSAAFAESGSEPSIQRVEMPGANLVEPVEVGFSGVTDAETPPIDVMPQFPNIVDLAGNLPANGGISSLMDADGNPVLVARLDDNFLMKPKNGPTSRTMINPMPELVEPQIAGSAVAVRFRSSVVNVAD